jgi:hypothetical protein
VAKSVREGGRRLSSKSKEESEATMVVNDCERADLVIASSSRLWGRELWSSERDG